MAKRTYHHHEEVLYRRMKYAVLGMILIPALMVILFVFYGPFIGSIFGVFSKNRRELTKKDTIAPPAPIIENAPNATNQSTITLGGFAESGSTIKIYVNGPEVATTVATSDGTFAVENLELIKGNNNIFAKSIDAEGNESGKSVTLNIAYDTDSPDITIESPEDGDTVRNLNKRVLIKGKVSEKSTITINDRSAILRPDLSFEFPLGVEAGDVEVKIVAKDEAGNEKEEILKIKYVQGQEY